ncbi:MAG: DUF885 family protein [Alphaproteobacteria bacterium]|jgi:uncharacterized protein (DUF885 family)|nr:DUF885 family protein [Alphaproteobacteria bacterium]MBU2040695.1 DUF885 family protein [Alphaproteobacteria bacterium]MBU2126617.1 DUF885 family protein [Alphaproteobacteria bacterium]MBU2208607.1 DUF885 family protein [Alphaproteobacteria bacterium]MBU2292215.1 DUF885 family protein [Alphaproteobacteria bacterium]
MKLVIAVGAAAMLATVASPVAASPLRVQTEAVRNAQNPALASVLADYEAYLRAVDPISAGMEGDRAALSRMPDSSRAFEVAQEPVLKGFADRLAAIDPARLSDDDRLNHSFLTYVLRRARARIPLDTGRIDAFNSEGGPGQSLAYLSAVTRIATVADAEAWIARLEAMPAIYADQLAGARRGLETGLVQPRSIVENALSLIEPDAALTLEADPLLKPFAALPASIPAAQQAALRERAARAVTDGIMPQRREWARFLREDYLPRAPETLGLVHRPGGRELYGFLVRGFTTTELTPDEVHAIGLEEVARIRGRMDAEMQAAGWTGDFASFLTFLRTDPQFYATTREGLLEKASEMAKRADDGLPALFGTLPRLPYGVRPVPREIEANYTTGRYNPGSMENGIAGGYMVNTSSLDQRGLYELPALTLHEGVPGHHLQIALQQEAEDGPYFRRSVDVTAFVEGWGLYAEFLGEEMGFYRTPYERFGRLSYEMWRACRLVSDTGIHWLGWDIEQARACFRDNSALAPLNIETELQRYIGWPGQATAYKIGEIRLRGVRSRAEAELGDRFDVRRFHDALLVDGPLPMALLDERMDRWIAEEKARPAN